MALTHKLPPQAYTRDTLVKAIEWLSGQPATVRERANSADLIVSHYLQARRQAPATLSEMPPSQESFKTELRSLADDMKPFAEPLPPPPTPPPAPEPSAIPKAAPKAHASPLRSASRRTAREVEPPVAEDGAEEYMNPHRQESLFRHQGLMQTQELTPRQDLAPRQELAPRPEPIPRTEPSVRATEVTVKAVAWTVDPRSLQIARQLQETLNLSSEGEALRMLVSLGAERLRGLLP